MKLAIPASFLIVLFNLYAEKIEVQYANGLERRFRLELQRGDRVSASEKFQSVHKVERAKKEWLAYLEFLGQKPPATFVVPEVKLLKDVRSYPWVNARSDSKNALLREIPTVEAWHPNWTLNMLRTRRERKAGENNVLPTNLKMSDHVAEKRKKKKNVRDRNPYVLSVEQQLQYPMDTISKIINSRLLKIQVPKIFSDRYWWFWKKNAKGEWKKTIHTGKGMKKFWQLFPVGEEIQYLFTFKNTLPANTVKANYHFIIDTQKPEIKTFNVTEENGSLKFKWMVSDQHMAPEPVRITLYGERGTVFTILGGLPAEGDHDALKDTGPEELKFALLEVTDLANNFSTASLEF